MTTRPPGWYFLNPNDSFVQYWDGQKFTNDVTASFGKEFPVFDINYVAPKVPRRKMNWQEQQSNNDVLAVKVSKAITKVTAGVLGILFLFIFVGCSISLKVPRNNEENSALPENTPV